jgi:hypothetical protein
MFVWIGIDVLEIEGVENDLETVDGGNVYDDLENTKRSSERKKERWLQHPLKTRSA